MWEPPEYPGSCFDLHFDRFDGFIFEAEKPFENVCATGASLRAAYGSAGTWQPCLLHFCHSRPGCCLGPFHVHHGKQIASFFFVIGKHLKTEQGLEASQKSKVI